MKTERIFKSEKGLYKILRIYVLETSTAQDYITNYMDTVLKHIAHRLLEDDIKEVKNKRLHL